MTSTDSIIAFPAWVPDGIRRAATMMAAAPLAPRPIVERLSTDPRMQTVWRELTKHARDGHRPTAEPKYRSTVPPETHSWTALATAFQAHAVKQRTFGNDDRARDLEAQARMMPFLDRSAETFNPSPAMKHDMALAALFAQAVARRAEEKATMKQSELQARVVEERERGRYGVAKALESLPTDPYAARFIVARRRTDGHLEAYVETMAQICRDLFGNDFPGIVATIANVAFARNDLTREKVRTILRRRPAQSA